MRVFFAGMLLVLLGANCALAQLQPPTPSAGQISSDQQKHTAKAKKKAHNDQRGTPKNPLVVQLSKTQQDERRADGEANDTHQEAANNRHLLIATCALAILAALQWLVMLWQGRQLRRSVDAVQTGERAYVFPGNPNAFIKPTGSALLYIKSIPLDSNTPKPRVNFDVINYGRSPAIIIQIQAEILIQAELPPYPTFKHSTTWEGETVLAKDSPSLATDCFFHRHITSEELDQLNSGKITVYFFGYVQYMDVFGYLHQRGFCNRFSDKSVNGVVQLGGKAYNYSRSKKLPKERTPLWVRLTVRPLASISRKVCHLNEEAP